MMKVLVCGGRNFNDSHFIWAALDEISRSKNVTCLIHGDCRGVDRICGDWAQAKGIPVMVFPANWDFHGKAAGPIRNKSMIDLGKPQWLVAFEGGKGTDGMIKLAQSDGVPVWRPKGDL